MSAWALTIMKVIFNFVWVAVLVAALPASAQDVGEPPASTEPGAVTDDEGEGDSGTAADEDGAHDDPSDESAVDEGAADEAAVVPPRVLAMAEPVRPPEGGDAEVRVLLRITVGVEGQVTDAEVLESGGPGFDAAVLEAVRAARFEPARRGDQAIPVRLPYQYVFPARVTGEAPGGVTPRSSGVAGVDPDAVTDADDDALTGAEPGVLADAEDAVTGADPDTTEDDALDDAPAFGAEGSVRSAAEERRHSAEAVDVVDLDDAQTRTADLGEVLARTDGVTVRRSGGLGSAERVSLVGLEGRQIRYFLDGIPLRYMGFASGLANIPVGLVDRIEIFRGVVPIRYGADAVGGAIDLVSDPVRRSGASFSYQAGSFATHRLSGSGEVLHPETGLFLRAAAYLDSAENDYDVDVEVANASGRREPRTVDLFNADYRAYGGLLELGVADRPGARLASIRGFGTRYERGVPHDIAMNIPYGDVRYGQDDVGFVARYENDFLRDRLTLALAAGFVTHRISFRDEGTCRWNWLEQCVRELDPPGEMGGIVAGGRHLRTAERSTYARANLTYRPAEHHALTLSISPDFDFRETEGATVATGLLTGTSTREMVVAGLAWDLRFAERFENSLFVKGYWQRLTADELNGMGVVTHVADEAAPGVGDSLRVDLGRDVYLKASYEWATRMPASDEYFGDGIRTVPSFQLVPERSHNVNLALNARTEHARFGELRTDVALFARHIRDLLWRTASDESFQFENIGNVRSLGATLKLAYVSPGDWVTVRGTATYLDSRNVSTTDRFADVNGDRVPNRPYLEGSSEVAVGVSDFFADHDRITGLWGFRYTHSFFLGYESRGGAGTQITVPDQFVMYAALRYAITRRPRSLSATIEVQNLADAAVFDFYGVQRPGRAVYAKLAVDL